MGSLFPLKSRRARALFSEMLLLLPLPCWLCKLGPPDSLLHACADTPGLFKLGSVQPRLASNSHTFHLYFPSAGSQTHVRVPDLTFGYKAYCQILSVTWEVFVTKQVSTGQLVYSRHSLCAH